MQYFLKLYKLYMNNINLYDIQMYIFSCVQYLYSIPSCILCKIIFINQIFYSKFQKLLFLLRIQHLIVFSILMFSLSLFISLFLNFISINIVQYIIFSFFIGFCGFQLYINYYIDQLIDLIYQESKKYRNKLI